MKCVVYTAHFIEKKQDFFCQLNWEGEVLLDYVQQRTNRINAPPLQTQRQLVASGDVVNRIGYKLVVLCNIIHLPDYK